MRFSRRISLVISLVVAVIVGPAVHHTARALQSTEPPPTGDGIVRAQAKANDIHGPFLLTARNLQRLPPVEDVEVETEDDPTPVPPDGPCTDCDPPGPGEPRAVQQTPSPTGTPWLPAPTLGGVDPQIAVGKVYIVITTGGQIAFYDKAGQLLTDATNTAVTPVLVASFFQNLVPSMNNSLNLPAGANTNTYQLNGFYDARVVYDSFRDRFWIVALAANTANNSDPATTLDRASRRSKMMLAVSVDDDPRHGWYQYWWNAVIDDGVCNDPNKKTCAGTYNQPGDAGDYPSVGISDRFFMVSNHVAWYDPLKPAAKTNQERYAVVHVIPADSYAGLAPPAPNWAYWDIRYPNQSSVLQYSLQPAVHHSVDPGGFAYLADNTLSNGTKKTLVVLGFSYLEGAFAPPLHAVGVPVKSFAPAVDAPQKDGNLVGYTLKWSNIVYFTLKAAFRDNRLYVSWPDCRDWTAIGSCQSSNRLVRVDTTQFPSNQIPTTPASGFIDRPFGWRSIIDDPPSELAYYGLPVVEVNRNGDMVLVYQRSSTDLYPEVRYSVQYANDPDLLPSRLLKAGEGPLGKNQTDLGGIAVDPFDDTAVWMTHAYAAGTVAPAAQQLVVGKVFGDTYPDLYVKGPLTVTHNGARTAVQVEVNATIANQGDGVAFTPKVSLIVRQLNTGNAPIAIGSVVLPDLAPGAVQPVTISGFVNYLTVPANYSVEVFVDPANVIAEYSEANNTALWDLALHVGLGRRP